MSPLEMLTVILLAFAAWFALTRTSAVPRQLWLTPAAAFGCSLLNLGLAAMSTTFIEGIRATAGTSEASQAAAFNALLPEAHRPLYISVICLGVFWVLLRSASLGPQGRGGALGGGFAALMMAATAASLGFAMAYHVGFMFLFDGDLQRSLMTGTVVLSALTLVVAAAAGFWTFVRSSEWQEDAQAA